MKNITVSDVTLKSTMGLKGQTLSFKEKLEIAKNLNELGVDVIELSHVFGDKTDEVLIKTISTCVNKSVLSIDAGNSIEQMEKSFSLIASAKKKRICVSIPVSAVQMEYSVSKKPKSVLELLKNMTEKAVSLCDDVEVSLLDATRADFTFLAEAVKLALSCGVKTITLTDIAGNLLPCELGEFVKKVKDVFLDNKNVNLTLSCSNEFYMATASYLTAFSYGADGVKVSFIKESLLPTAEQISSVINSLGMNKGCACNINKTAVGRISEKIKSFFSHKAEVASVKEFNQEGIKGKISQSELSKIVKKLGYELSSEDMKKVYSEYLRLSEKKTVNERELDVIIATYSLQVPETYSLVKYSVQSSNITDAVASVYLNKDGKELSGLSFGNGSVDAAFLALENVIGRHFELDDFELSSVTEGKEAFGQAIVRLNVNGKIYSGRGVSTDIVGASIRAYVSALNKIAYEEQV